MTRRAMLVATILFALGVPLARAAEDPSASRPGWAIQLCPVDLPCADLTDPKPSKTDCMIQLAGLRIAAKGARLSCERRPVTAEASR